MSLRAEVYATLAELDRFASTAGTGKLDLKEEALAWASLEVEGPAGLDRKGIYRGPVESYDSVVSAVAIANGAVAVDAAPNSAGRTLIVRKTDADRSITAGILTVTQANPALVETFDLSKGDEIHGIEFFTAAVTAALSGVSGAGAGDVLDVGTSAGLVELYSPRAGQVEIRPRQWPIRRVHKLWESYDRIFTDPTKLVAGTDYELRNTDSIRRAIARLSSGQDSSWISGRRVIKGQLSLGWKGNGEVPFNVKAVVLDLAAWWFGWATGKRFGLQSETDASGTRTYSGPPMITEGMRARLGGEIRTEVDPTGEEAA